MRDTYCNKKPARAQAFVLWLALCWPAWPAASTGAAPQDFAGTGIIKIHHGQPAHDFALQDTRGNWLRLSSFRGKVVFLNFWATWCPPCRHEMPSMERLYRELGGSGLAMLAVSVKENRSKVAEFMKALKLTFPALLDTDGRVSRQYGTIGLPGTYIIDRAGKLIGHKPGAKNWGTPEVMAFFKRLLGEPGPSAEEPASVVLDTPPLPALLRVKTSAASLHSQQDASSEVVARPGRGETLQPLAKASGGGESWYLVRSPQGHVGWIRLGEVEAQAAGR